MVVSVAVRSPDVFEVTDRLVVAAVLTPELPVSDWIRDLDAWIGRSSASIAGNPVIIDLSHVELSKIEVWDLLTQLKTRNLRILSVEGVNPSWVALGLRPLPGTGKAMDELPDCDHEPTVSNGPEPTALVLDGSVRSGQSIVFPNGDITVTGSVASGAELVAGGSIHVYGCLRGRALAGAYGNHCARIFCSRLEAELIAIGGLYKTSDHMEADMRGRPIQAWLDGEILRTAVRGCEQRRI